MKLYLATEWIYGDDREGGDPGHTQINGVFTSMKKLKEVMPGTGDRDIKEIESDVDYSNTGTYDRII